MQPEKGSATHGSSLHGGHISSGEPRRNSPASAQQEMAMDHTTTGLPGCPAHTHQLPQPAAPGQGGTELQGSCSSTEVVRWAYSDSGSCHQNTAWTTVFFSTSCSTSNIHPQVSCVSCRCITHETEVTKRDLLMPYHQKAFFGSLKQSPRELAEVMVPASCRHAYT